MAGIYHIGKCAECQQEFPDWAGIEDWARYSDPVGYQRIKEQQEALGN